MSAFAVVAAIIFLLAIGSLHSDQFNPTGVNRTPLFHSNDYQSILYKYRGQSIIIVAKVYRCMQERTQLMSNCFATQELPRARAPSLISG